MARRNIMASSQLAEQMISWQKSDDQPLSIRKKMKEAVSENKVGGNRFYLDPSSQELYFTYREMEIAMFLFQPLTYKVIGDKMDLSDRTVECHVRRMRIKVGCKDRFELIDRIGSLEAVVSFKREYLSHHNVVSIRGDE